MKLLTGDLRGTSGDEAAAEVRARLARLPRKPAPPPRPSPPGPGTGARPPFLVVGADELDAERDKWLDGTPPTNADLPTALPSLFPHQPTLKATGTF